MQARRVILPVIAILAVSIGWVWEGLPNLTREEMQPQEIAMQNESPASDISMVAPSLTRERIQSQEEKVSPMEVEIPYPAGVANISGFVVNKLSGERFHAWVVIYQDGEEYGGARCFPDEPFDFEVERGHEYFLHVQKIIDADGYRAPDSPFRYSRVGSAQLERHIFVPIHSEQTSWEMELEIFQAGSVVGKIMAPDGAPILGARYQLVKTEVLEGIASIGRGSVDDAGSFKKIFGESKTVVLRFDFCLAKNPAHRALIPPITAEIQLLEGQNLDLGTFRATRGHASLSGTVFDQMGDPYVGLEINCHQVDRGRAALLATMETDRNGRFSFHGLGVGEVEIDLTTGGVHMRYLIADMRYAWEVATLKTTIHADREDIDLGEFVVPRPIAFRQKVKIEGGTKDSYFLIIETLVDESKAATIETLTSHYSQEKPIPGWSIAQAVAPFFWTETPPWFNYKPEITVLFGQEAIREIACRLPHAPISVLVFYSKDGAVSGRSQVTIYPSSSSPATVIIPMPK